MGRFRQTLRRFAGLGCCVLTLLAVSVVSSGEEAVPLERVVALARQRAPAIAGARARVVQAEGRTFSRSVPTDPSVIGEIGRGEPVGGGPSGREWGLRLEQFLPSPRSTQAWIRAGNADIEASRSDVVAATAGVVLEAQRLYYQAAVAQAQARALEEAARDAQSLLDVVGRRVDLGEASEGDRLRTRVEALRAGAEARAASAEAMAGRAALNRFLLGALGDDFTLSSDLDPGRISLPPANALELALQANPEYVAAQNRLEARRWTLSAERRSLLPGLAFSLFRADEIDKTSTGLTLGLTVPLWNRNQGNIRSAQGELAELEAQVTELNALIQADMERLLLTERAARENAVSFSREILPASAEALSIVRFSLEQGEANLLAWLEARRSYLETLRASYGAQLEAFLRRAELARLMGVTDAQ